MGENVDNYVAESRFWWVKYLPLILAFGYVPIIVRGCFYARPVLSEQVWFSNGTLFDFFLFYKSLGIIACGGVSLAICVIFFFNEFKNLGRMFIPIWIYVVFCILSGVFSPYKSLVFTGSYEMMEGLPVILAYVALMVSTAIYIKRDGAKGIKLIVAAAIPGILIIAIIGLLQFFGLDFFKTSIGLSIIAGKNMLAALGGIATDSENPVYTTLYNADNACFYMIMTAAMLFGLSKSIDPDEKLKKRSVFVAGILCITVAFFTKVITGYIIAAGLFIIFVTIWSLREEYWALPAAICAILVACVVFLVMGSDGRAGRIKEAVGLTDYYEPPIEGIEVSGVMIDFKLKDGDFWLNCETTKDEAGVETINFSGKNRGDDIFCDRFETVDGLFFVFTGINGRESVQIDQIRESENKEKVYFTVSFNHGDGISTYWKFVHDRPKWHVFYVNDLGAEVDLPREIEKSDLFPDTLFNKRGSIWNFTIPTLSKHIFLGSGANTFIMVYPQEDYIYESRYGIRFLDVKPHSMYLQQWSDNGILALIGFLTFVACFWIKTAKRLTTEYGKTEEGHFAMSALLSSSAMLIAGITMDSNVCTSTVFWIVLGIMVGLCTREKRLQTAD